MMPPEITKEFKEAKLAEDIKSGGMKQSDDTSYTVSQGDPALLARAVFLVDNSGSNQVSYATLVNIKLVFVKSQNPAKRNDRIYMVNGLAIQGHDRSAIQSFLDSFELK
jgi:hypothetical protein